MTILYNVCHIAVISPTGLCHCKLCVSVSLTGVVFRFEQPIYNILESGFFQEVCVLLVMGSLDRQVIVDVETGTTGTATGRNQFFA